MLHRAFASGCTAMTGIEAVSNAVPLFRKPTVPNAQLTLTIIVAFLLAIAYLCPASWHARMTRRFILWNFVPLFPYNRERTARIHREEI